LTFWPSLAKLTQARQRTESTPAIIDRCQNVAIVAAIAAWRTTPLRAVLTGKQWGLH
jgi:hypothetical protein